MYKIQLNYIMLFKNIFFIDGFKYFKFGVSFTSVDCDYELRRRIFTFQI